MHRYRNFYRNKNEKSWGVEEGREEPNQDQINHRVGEGRISSSSPEVDVLVVGTHRIPRR
jgi:hypothetical protein